MFEKMGGEVWGDFWETFEDDFSKKYREHVDLREIYMIQVLILQWIRSGTEQILFVCPIGSKISDYPYYPYYPY